MKNLFNCIEFLNVPDILLKTLANFEKNIFFYVAAYEEIHGPPTLFLNFFLRFKANADDYHAVQWTQLNI